MPLDPKWARNDLTDPFADNSTGAITASDLRDFAADITTDAVAADWFVISSGAISTGLYAGWTTQDQSVDVLLNGDSGHTITSSGGWVHSTWAAVPDNGNDEAHTAQYQGQDYSGTAVPTTPNLLLYVSIFSTDGTAPTVTLNDSTDGVRITPIVRFHNDADFTTPTSVYNAGRSGIWTAANGPVDLTGTQLLKFPSLSPLFMQLGFRLDPAAGEMLQDGALPTLDISDLNFLIVARTAATEVP